MGDQKRLSRWYFGGAAAAGAVFFTHPLDLLKVTLQTQQEVKMTLGQVAKKIVKNQGRNLSLTNQLCNS